MPTQIRPALVPGTELLGELNDSGYRRAPFLVRRADGQMLQVTRLAYLVAAGADGTRTPGALATLVSKQSERPIDAAGVRFLVDQKLKPLGVITTGAAAAAVPCARPLLGLRGRTTLLPAKLTNALGNLLRPLFWPIVIISVVAGVAALDSWLFVVHGLNTAIGQVLHDPSLLLAVVGLTLVAAIFHELGHAAGCRAGGARPAQRTRTPSSFISSRRRRMTSRLKPIRNFTSSGLRDQFSVENA